MPRPRRSCRWCRLPPRQPGLTMGTAPGFTEQLVCIVAGTFPPRPAELLGSQKFETFLSEVGSVYDVVRARQSAATRRRGPSRTRPTRRQRPDVRAPRSDDTRADPRSRRRHAAAAGPPNGRRAHERERPRRRLLRLLRPVSGFGLRVPIQTFDGSEAPRRRRAATDHGLTQIAVSVTPSVVHTQRQSATSSENRRQSASAGPRPARACGACVG